MKFNQTIVNYFKLITIIKYSRKIIGKSHLHNSELINFIIYFNDIASSFTNKSMYILHSI